MNDQTNNEPTFTLAAAKVELDRQSCERGGHEPEWFSVLRKKDEVNGSILCRCGQYRWIAVRA